MVALFWDERILCFLPQRLKVGIQDAKREMFGENGLEVLVMAGDEKTKLFHALSREAINEGLRRDCLLYNNGC